MILGKVWLRLVAATWLVSSAAALEDVQVGTPATPTAPGGAANASASSAEPTNLAMATGGAAVAQTNGLAGGAATASATTQNTTPGATTSTTATAVGGDAGPTYNPSIQPSGGAAISQALVLEGAADQVIRIFSSATAGWGGSGRWGVTAGNGGSATAGAQGTATMAALLEATVTAVGGSVSYPQPPAGLGDGGSAYASGQLQNTGPRAVLTLNATSGAGGTWQGNPGTVGGPTAGLPGTVLFGPAFASAASSVLVQATGRGGAGGDAYRGTGTAGASVLLDNVVDGTAGDTVELRQIAIAGNGGYSHGNYGATGGNASSLLDRTIATGVLLGTVESTAGSGGGTYFIGGGPYPAVDSGTATSRIRLQNVTGSARAISRATTPSVTFYGGGAARSAQAEATALSGQALAGQGATADATATGGNARGSAFFGGGGGSANATAGATSAGGATSALATATGGHDDAISFALGGVAVATATGTNTGPGELTVTALATGGSARGGRGGDATATATAQSPGSATVNAQARAGLGLFRPPTGSSFDPRPGRAGAVATGTAGGGTIGSLASTSALQLPVSSLSTSTSGELRGTATHETRATIGLAAPTAQAAGSRQAGIFASAAPVATDVSAAFTGNAAASARFDLASTNQRLLLASLGAGHSTGGVAGPQTSTVSLQLTIDLAQIPVASQASLQLALLGSSATGAGFSILQFTATRQGVPILDLSFTQLAEAQTYFADHLLDLGALGGAASGTVDFGLQLRVTTAAEGDAFATTLFLGNAPIPEPATWLLFAAGSLILGGRLWRRD